MDEVVLRVDQPVGHLQGGVDDLLSLGRALPPWQRWQRMVDSVDELAHRLDRGPLTLLKGIEYLVGQLFGLVDRARARGAVVVRLRVVGALAAGLRLPVGGALAAALRFRVAGVLAAGLRLAWAIAVLPSVRGLVLSNATACSAVGGAEYDRRLG